MQVVHKTPLLPCLAAARRIIIALVLAAAVCVAAEDGPAAEARNENLFLWEGFESSPARRGWSVDEADDPARLTQDPQQATQGKASLRAEADFKAKGRILVRRVTRLKLEGLRCLLADVHAGEDGLRVSFAYKDTGGGWHESPLRKLARGWNRNIGCTIEELRTSVRTAPYFGRRDVVDEFYLVFHAKLGGKAVLHVDNLRFEGEPTEDWNRAPPRDIELYQPERGVERYGKFEVGVQFEGTYGNLFDPDDALVEGVFTSPEGESQTVRAFFAGYADSERFGRAWPIFLLRFAPTKIGRWTFLVRVRNPEGETNSRKRWFYVTDSDSPGFLQISRRDPRYFEFHNGDFYYPIGQNIAWTQDYPSYLKKQKETGQNWVRIWLCPWNLQLEKKPGRYDLEDAERLDGIIELAERSGIHVQLVLNYHGMVTGENWAKNPYNYKNDGPCYMPAQFFTNERARELFKRRLDYVLARWGYSTTVFAWELFNEADIAEYSTFSDVVKWHSEMSDYLEKKDPNNHLVTTSLHKDWARSEIWDLPNIDFLQAHVYEVDIAKKVLDLYFETRKFKKPFFVGEYGRGAAPGEAQKDPEGCDLRAALWGTFMVPVAGSTMPWWWDSYIRPHELERLFAPLAEFAKGTDRRAQNYRLIETAILRDDGKEIAVRGLLNSFSCYLWLHRPKDRAAGEDEVLVPRAQQVAFAGMLGGKYQVTILETSTGRVLRRSAVTCAHGKLVLELPESKHELAVKIEYQGATTPRFFTSPELLQLEEKAPPK